jgi:tetratricopeptide (TPR) repeat protein
VDDAKRAQAESKQENFRKGAAEMVTWIEGRRASGEAARYATLLPANRLAAEGKWDEARKIYADIRTREPQNVLVQYRLAWLDFVSGGVARALPEFTRLAATRAAPETIRAMSLLYVGRVYDLTGRRAEAIKTYEKVVDDFEKQRAADFARVGLLTPYKSKAKA